jgi:hypothetical protein
MMEHHPLFIPYCLVTLQRLILIGGNVQNWKATIMLSLIENF